MLSPYALTRPGGVQGQVVGLSRSLRAARARGDRVGPGRPRARSCPKRSASTIVIGRPTGAALERLGGAGALWPPRRRAGGARRAPRAASTWSTCTSRWPPWPPTAWCSPRRSRWSAPTTGPGSAAGCRCCSRWPSWWAGACRCGSPCPRPPARRASARAAATSRCCSTASTWSGSSRPSPSATRRAVRPCCSSVATRQRKGLRRRCSMPSPRVERPAVLWVVGDGPETRCSAAGTPSRTGSLARRARRRGAGRRGWPGRTCCARRRCRASRSAWCCSRAWRPDARWWLRTSTGIGPRRAGTPPWSRPATPTRWPRALGAALADAGEGSGAVVARGAQGGRGARPGLVDGDLAERYLDIYERAIERLPGRAVGWRPRGSAATVPGRRRRRGRGGDGLGARSSGSGWRQRRRRPAVGGGKRAAAARQPEPQSQPEQEPEPRPESSGQDRAAAGRGGGKPRAGQGARRGRANGHRPASDAAQTPGPGRGWATERWR